MNTPLANSKLSNTIVTVRIPSIGHTATVDYLNRLVFTNPGVVTMRRQIRNFVLVEYTFPTDGWAIKSFLKNLTAIFTPDFLSYTTKDVPMFQSDWDLFAHLLESMDWYYSFSDDHRVWVAGEAKLKEINLLAEKLSTIDNKRVVEMYNKRKK
jgi:hypothetical protein